MSVIVITNGCNNVWTFFKKPEVCYKKYLGPDWVADYNKNNCGCVVANHSSMFDVPMNSLQ